MSGDGWGEKRLFRACGLCSIDGRAAGEALACIEVTRPPAWQAPLGMCCLLVGFTCLLMVTATECLFWVEAQAPHQPDKRKGPEGWWERQTCPRYLLGLHHQQRGHMALGFVAISILCLESPGQPLHPHRPC